MFCHKFDEGPKAFSVIKKTFSLAVGEAKCYKVLACAKFYRELSAESKHTKF